MPRQATCTSKHSTPGPGDLTGVSVALAGTSANLRFCAAQKASKSPGTGRLAGIFSGSNPADASAVCVVTGHVLKDTDAILDYHFHDVDGAAAHGVDTVVVEWGYGAADFADGVGLPAASVSSIAELREALGV